jgi:localization factor PodJL
MRQHVLPRPDDLDLDVRAVAEAMAHRSGLSIEAWVAAALACRDPEGRQQPAGERRRAGDDLDRIIARVTETPRTQSAQGEDAGPQREASRDEVSKTAIALESMASWIEHAEERLSETARMSADQQDRMASALSQALAALKERLDSVERQVASERTAPARLEFPVQEAIQALAPLSQTLTGLRTDMSRLAESLEQPAAAVLPPALDGIRADIDHLRATLTGLATRDEVAAVDQAVRDLSGHLDAGHATKDVQTLAGSVAALCRRVQSLSEDVEEGVHRRLGAQIEEIKDRIDAAAKTGVDRFAVEFLAGQIADLRQELAARAEPQQIERLSDEVGALRLQVADLRDNQVGRTDFAALKNALETVCSALSRTVAAQEADTVPEQLQRLSRTLDALASRPEPEPTDLGPVAEQLALLTDRMAAITDTRLEQTEMLAARMERLSSQLDAVADRSSHEPVLKRFDRLEEELRQTCASGSALDALEQRIAALAEHIARPAPEPFRQAFDEAASHLKKLQDESASIAEKAARTVLQDALRGTPAAGDLDALKQGFVELKALQTRSDKKTQETLRAVRDALETLVARYPEQGGWAPRLAGTPAEAAGRASGEMPSADRLEAAVRRLHAAALSQIADASGQPRETSPAAPGVSEPPRGPTTPSAPPDDLSNVRVSFIAAARRASQTAASERAGPAAGEPPAATETPDGCEPASEETSSAPSLIERLRRSFDSRRRPLLFGLAFLVLAAGAAQILSAGRPEAQPSETPAPAATAMAPAKASAIVVASASPEAVSLLQAPDRIASVTASKFIVDPKTIGEIPAQLPKALGEAALSGDAAAIYEIASRASEGRGLAHDPALAAHLYERAAQAGFAPAQERLAMLYEKGVGLPRDTGLAATWYERAALAGNVRAMHNLATLLAAGANGKPDYPTALRWYSEAAETGLQDSQFNLGVLFARGIGTSTDLARAFKWFTLAAAQGDAEAARKRDDIATRLDPAGLAAAKSMVEQWRPRAVDPAANAGGSAVRGQTAALEQAVGRRG